MLPAHLLYFCLWWQHFSSLLIAFICTAFAFQARASMTTMSTQWLSTQKAHTAHEQKFSYLGFDRPNYYALPTDASDKEMSNPLQNDSFQTLLGIQTQVFCTDFRICQTNFSSRHHLQADHHLCSCDFTLSQRSLIGHILECSLSTRTYENRGKIKHALCKHWLKMVWQIQWSTSGHKFDN